MDTYPGERTPFFLRSSKWSYPRILLGVVVSLSGLFALTAMILAGVNLERSARPAILPPPSPSPCTAPGETRRTSDYLLRTERAYENAARPVPCHVNNGDEDFYANKLGTFTKGLQHNALGEVDPVQFQQYVNGIQMRRFDDIPRAVGAQRRYVNPQAGLAFDLLGGDAHYYTQPPAPAFNSSLAAIEYLEVAWMAALRDIPFDQYGMDALSTQAIADLDAHPDFNGPKPVTGQNLFRGLSPGCDVGPYLSQFFYQPINYGANNIKMKVSPHTPGVDFMTTFAEYLNIQNGMNPAFSESLSGPDRYMMNGRDIANWVHIDAIWQAYHMAALSLFTMGAPFNPTNPYLSSTNQEGFVTFGQAHVVTATAEVATHALHAVWHQKWFVHRRLRPEVYGGRIHVNKTMSTNYPLHNSLLTSPVLGILHASHGTYLLPQAFPEGSPMHPSYGAGHATVAGACVTVLKAMFNEDWSIPSPLAPGPGGATVVPFTLGNLTVGGELNKLANNVALGRNIAGVHWRTDGTHSLNMGEQVAIDFLRDYKRTYNEQFIGWRFKGFDGRQINI